MSDRNGPHDLPARADSLLDSLEEMFPGVEYPDDEAEREAIRKYNADRDALAMEAYLAGAGIPAKLQQGYDESAAPRPKEVLIIAPRAWGRKQLAWYLMWAQKGLWVPAHEAVSILFGQNERKADRLRTASIVAIDRLGSEAEKASPALEKIMLARYDDNLQTGLVTSMSWAELCSRYPGLMDPATGVLEPGDVCVLRKGKRND